MLVMRHIDNAADCNYTYNNEYKGNSDGNEINCEMTVIN